MNLAKKLRVGLHVLLLLVFPLTLIYSTAGMAQETPKKGTLQWYLNGPRKEWSDADYNKYYAWRDKMYKRLAKSAQGSDDQILRRQKTIMNGNKITTEIWNFGSISSPGNRVTDIVWEGLGYGYEFAPFICAEVPVTPRSHQDAYIKTDENGSPIVDAKGDTVWAARVISDGLISLGGEVSPDGKVFWGWEPLAYSDEGVPYADPNNDRIPTSNDIDRDGDGKPDSWPDGWYNTILKQYVWPGALRQGSTNADMEAFFVIDDRRNAEFEYYPFPEDSLRRGLGLEIVSRYYQWANPLAEDIIFLIYKVTNVSDKELNEVIFGMWGDPHIGGPSNWPDDLSFFDREINMVYAWDEDGISDVAGRPPGFFGFKFLESPGNPDDGIDNDGDGLIDESRANGIDDDGDWDPEKNDVGIDGIPNTGDTGENDGVPTAGDPFDIRQPGEPNFEWTDLDEADMIGLTSFSAPPFTGQNRISNDDYIYRNFLIPGKFDSANSTQAGDNVFLYGSGTLTLPAKSARRFSVALIIGQDLQDLLLNAETAQQIYEINYQFAKPPEKPTLSAVPGDRRVTLYWDDVAESSFDPISKKFDFEGYVIYRSTDPQFADKQTITDANGSRFLFEPLKTVTGATAKFDLVNEFSGLSPIVYPGRGVAYNLGNNTGLRHSFVDSNNVINGQTYYYAVVSYDHGDIELEIPPTESSKNITIDPERDEVTLDINTAQVVPRAPAAGLESAHLKDAEASSGITQVSGVATGHMMLDIVDPRAVQDENEFVITFQEEPTRYTIEDMTTVQVTYLAKLDQFVQMPNGNINEETFVMASLEGGQIFIRDVDYELLANTGQVRAIPGGGLQNGQQYSVSYRYFPIVDSERLNFEEGNPFFDGMQIFVQNQPLDLDTSRTKWTPTSNSTYVGVVKPFNNQARFMFPADYEIRWSAQLVDSSSRPGYGYIKANFQVWDVTKGRIPKHQRIIILEKSSSKDSVWSPGERVIILEGDEGIKGTWEFTFLLPAAGDTIVPTDGDVFFIGTTRPFTSEDSYSFTTIASKIQQEKAQNQLDRITVVPNPYVVTNVIEPLDRQNPRDRGPRRLYFNHLPQKCTIRIYTVSGELVDTIEHESSIDDGIEYWDLTTKDNFSIAYGLYIYYVDAGELGQKIGRFAVIK